jgi:Fe-S oxidoreductase
MSETTKISVPIISEKHANGEKPEYLFWVGSMGAFDDRYQKVTRAFVRILHHLGVDYAVLGTEEVSSGDAARRAGNEMLFQMQAMQNIELFNQYEVQKILTCDPHAFNTFKNEYGEFGGHYEVIHHTLFLEKMISEGKLTLSGEAFKDMKVTYHDPCYLGRGNGVYDAPRRIIERLPVDLVEMPRNRSFSLCCGAGGAQMFKEAEKGTHEVYEERTNEALETGAKIVVTACPYCMTMITDGIKYKDKEEEVRNLDVAELVAEGLNL